MKKILLAGLCLMMCLFLTGCSDSMKDQRATIDIGNKLSRDQPTPIDIDYSLERYNLIRRAYWVNGQREKAAAVGKLRRWTRFWHRTRRVRMPQAQIGCRMWMDPMVKTIMAFSSLRRMVSISSGLGFISIRIFRSRLKTRSWPIRRGLKWKTTLKTRWL